MSRLSLSPGDLDFLDGNVPLPSPCSIPATPSPYGSRKMSWLKLPPSLNDEAFASTATHLDVPATPSPNGGSYPIGVTAPSTSDHLTVCELDYGRLQQEIHTASTPLHPAALAPQFGVPYHSQGPRVPPPTHAPQLFWEIEGLDDGPPAPEYLPQEHNAGLGSKLAQQLLEQFAAGDGGMHNVKVKNTFIDSGLVRSPSLEHLRETKSCPGSKLPTPLTTPRCESQRKGVKKELEAMPGISDAAFLSLVEKISRQRSSPKPSLQTAAWQVHPNQTFSQYYGHGQARPSKSAPQVVRLERLLAFNGLDFVLPEPPRVQQPFVPRRQAAPDIRVSKAALPRLGSPDLPSVGSLGHHVHRCKPCAFIQRMGCSNGVQCNFCHLCEPGEKKRRRKEKRALIGAARKLQVED